MRIDVLYYMEIKICLKNTAKPQREGVGVQPWAAGGTYIR